MKTARFLRFSLRVAASWKKRRDLSAKDVREKLRADFVIVPGRTRGKFSTDLFLAVSPERGSGVAVHESPPAEKLEDIHEWHVCIHTYTWSVHHVFSSQVDK